MTHRLNINLHMSAGSSSPLTFEVAAEKVVDVIAKLEDPNAVLRFDETDARGRRRGEIVIPVRAVTHVSHDLV